MEYKGGRKMKKFKVKVIFQQENEFEVKAENEQEILRAINEIGPLTNISMTGGVGFKRVKKGEVVRIVKEVS